MNEECKTCMERMICESNEYASALSKLRRRFVNFMRTENYSDDEIMNLLDVNKEQFKLIVSSDTFPWNEK